MIEIQENWRSCARNGDLFAVFEYPIYTDASVSQEFKDPRSPYHLLNPSARHPQAGAVLPAILLRASLYGDEHIADLQEAQKQHHHGGNLADEIAALLCLCTGARMTAGGASRRFGGRNEFGEVIGWDYRPYPTLTMSERNRVLPNVASHVNLNKAHQIMRIPTLSADQCAALVKAARLYQNALWLAESEPSFGWLMMVSALEVAAGQWRSEKGSPSERLVESKPELAELLTNVGGQAHLAQVADHIEHTLGATKKFTDFVIAHLPAEPEQRPSEELRVKWDAKSMKKILNSIYGFRSNALHNGASFPSPMCSPPLIESADEIFSETASVGTHTRAGGKIWSSSEAPLSMHVFNYITRNALLNWWDNMPEHNDVASDNCPPIPCR